MPTTLECCLCSQIEGRQENDLIARLLPDEPYARRVLIESESFAVIPSLGALAAGYSLLCPKTHVRSFASLDPRLDAEYEAMKARLRALLRNALIFEHGMARSGGKVVCTVDHAHMHFVPLPDIFDFSVLDLDEWTEIDGSVASLRCHTNGGEYIFCETPDGARRLITSGEFESQHMRKLVARGLGNADRWNWREVPNPRAAHDTWRQFA